jgi:succinyl-CoA synthetase alpha subunit
MLSTQNKSRLVGANAPGIISASGYCRIGFQPLMTYSPGPVGVVAKSGTLSYETVASLTRAGMGQSLCIAMGGDVVAGTDFVDALKVFESDDDTQGIVLVGEVGGTGEEEAAEWIKDYKKRVKNPKPISALVGGICAKPGKVMGHAGAWAAPGEGSSLDKWKALESAGVTMVDHPEKFGPVMKQLMSGQSVTSAIKPGSPGFGQRRSYHTARRRPQLNSSVQSSQQTRSLHLRTDQAVDLLNKYGIQAAETSKDESDSRLLVITVARSARSPTIIVSPTTREDAVHHRSVKIPYSYETGPESEQLKEALKVLQLSSASAPIQASVSELITKLAELFKEKEAVSLEVRINAPDGESGISVYAPNLNFDDAAFRSTKRHEDLHALRDTSLEDPTELAAEPDGIVYVKLVKPTPGDAPRNIGTLVNGAGLAMNTVDALESYGGYATNFLDTGGKATSETVKKSFELILRDDRVKVVFVNIFGGLTLGDMIARGVILAFKELEMSKPVVVRIRGTNEAEGQKLIAESGLKLFAYHDFAEAAEKVVELANA